MTELETELLKKYPFLQCRRIDDTPVKDCTYLGGIPNGWVKAFGRQMCEDFAKAAEEDGVKLDYLRVIDAKEKFGGLRWYWGRTGKSRRLEEVTGKYEEVASAFCAKCGAHPVMMTTGYVLPLCEECWKAWRERSISEDATRPFKAEFPDITVTRTVDGKEVSEKMDLKPLFDDIVRRQ